MKKNRKWFYFKSILYLKNIGAKALLCVLLGFMLFMPREAVAQQQKVTFHLKSATVQDVFREINRQTGLDFVYSAVQLKEIEPVTLKVKNMVLSEVLEELFKGGYFEYKFEMNSIIIKRKAVVPESLETIALNGKVMDAQGTPMVGVTVFLKGTTVGTITREDGTFSFVAGKIQKPVLVFSFVGMKRVERAIEPGKTLNVVMEEDAASLDEVVITGYQTIDKRRNTSAVQTLKMDDIKVPGIQTVDQLLEGRVPGMIFMQNSGQVGAAPKLRVRGTSTVLGNQEPVWVLDGIVLRDPVNVSPSLINNLDFVNLVGNAIAGINPEDIERIDILKDASATALYGAKAANGVINITTKRGKAGPPSVTYSMSGKFTARPRYTDKSIYLMNSRERVDYSREIVEKGLSFPNINNWVGYEGALHKYTSGALTPEQFRNEVDRIETVNTDWFDLITEDVFSNSHTLSLSGGSSNIRYYASIGYANDKGVIKGEKNDRYSTSLNINGSFNRFSFAFGILANKGVREYTNGEVNILNYAYNTSRAVPAFNEDGSLFFYDVAGNGDASNDLPLAFNALHEMQNARDQYNNSGVTMNTNLSYRFSDCFKGQFIFSYGINNNQQETFMDESSFYAANLRGTNYRTELSTGQKSISLLPVGGEYRENSG